MAVNSPRSQFIRFSVVGLGNTALDCGVFFMLNLAGLPYLIAQVISYSAGMFNSFLFNRRWTFEATGNRFHREFVKFAISNTMSLILTSGLLFYLYDINHATLWFSKFFATGCGILVNFTLSRVWVFRVHQEAGDMI